MIEDIGNLDLGLDDDEEDDSDDDDDDDDEDDSDDDDRRSGGRAATKRDSKMEQLFNYFDTNETGTLDYKQLSTFFQVFNFEEQNYADKRAYKVIEKGGPFNIDKFIDHYDHGDDSHLLINKICQDRINPEHVSLVELINELIQNGEIEYYCNKIGYEIYPETDRGKDFLLVFPDWSDGRKAEDVEFLTNKIKEFGKQAVELDKEAHDTIKSGGGFGETICSEIIENYKMAIVAWFRLLLLDQNHCHTMLEKKIAGYAVRVDQLTRKSYPR